MALATITTISPPRHLESESYSLQHASSWLRMNAGGMLSTCKSNGKWERPFPFGPLVGEEDSNPRHCGTGRSYLVKYLAKNSYLKGNGGVQRFPRAGRRLALECKGRRELDCKTHPSKPPQKKWTTEEEVTLVKAWINESENPITGIVQRFSIYSHICSLILEVNRAVVLRATWVALVQNTPPTEY
ncbi:hypothetical protein OSB04_000941 [Centaurea solstitialis]|uniref:Uncharacterized protein n=1 Tax=Centaurea solstitialis TaxID=347529 RepID=A0AA38TQ33_9ASTR|nr:hypothetical protein OSB04_000941 [Centaurea solstitialis]